MGRPVAGAPPVIPQQNGAVMAKQQADKAEDMTRRKFEEALARKSQVRKASKEGRDAVNGGTDPASRRRTGGDKQ